jgi:tetratricopeptide (TPR) repeat protein
LVPVVPALAVAVLAFGPIDRGLSLRTLLQRFEFWENSVYLAREVPLTGAGLGLESVQLVYRAYFLPSYPPFSHAHNIYLQGLLEYGVLGLLGLLGLGVATLRVGWRAVDGLDRWTTAARLAGFGVALAMFTTGLTEVVMHTTLGSAIALGALGLLGATSERRDTADSASTARGATAAGSTVGQPVGVPPVTPVGSVGHAPASPAFGPAWRWGRGSRAMLLGLAALVALLVVAGLTLRDHEARLGARVLLNLGTADLNRGALSETLGRDDREAALERAVRLLELASTLDPNDSTIQRNLSLALAASDDTRSARATANRARELTSTTSKADLLQLGRAYVATSDWGNAIRAWQAAEAAPQLIQLGNRLIRVRNFDQAVNAFVATAHVDPHSRGAYDGIVRAARERKLTVDETVGELEPLLESGAPTEFGARLQAARVLREAGRLHDAGQHLLRAEQIAASPELTFEFGLLMLAAGDPAAAVPFLFRSADDLPYDPERWLWLARARSEAGLYEEAVSTIHRGLAEIDPSGQFGPAAPRLPPTAAVRAVEIKRSERALLLGVLGESLVRLGRPDEALPALDEAVDALPKDAWLAATRDEAVAVRDGAPPNRLLNPSFDREGTWSIRSQAWWEPPTVETLLNEAPVVADGRVRLAPVDPATRLLVQEVRRLEPGGRYRLTVRLRAESLGAGSVRVYLADRNRRDDLPTLVEAREAAEWTTVTVEEVAPRSPSSSLTVAIGLTPEAPPGAAVWCDEATLVRIDDPS